MRLDEIAAANAATLDFARSRRPVSGSNIVGGMRREHPYFGLVEVDFPLTGTATMACFNDDAVVLEAVWNGTLVHERYSIMLWQQLAMTSEVVLDIGAYTGIYALGAVAANEKCKVVAFEPIPHIFARLIANVAVNGFNGIVCMNNCLSNAPADLTMQVPIGPSMFTSGASVISPERVDTDADNDKLLHVRAERLDTLLTSTGRIAGRPIGAVKIDVEMHEPEVLMGASATFGEHRPIILAEVLRPNLVASLLHAAPANYSLRFVIEDELTLTDDAGAFERSPTSMNALLVPDERLDEVERMAKNVALAAPPDADLQSDGAAARLRRLRAQLVVKMGRLNRK